MGELVLDGKMEKAGISRTPGILEDYGHEILSALRRKTITLATTNGVEVALFNIESIAPPWHLSRTS
jgi:hypothetical protein